jgi:serine/threonine protein kinase
MNRDITIGRSGNDVKFYGNHIMKAFLVDNMLYTAIIKHIWTLGAKSRMWNEFLIFDYLSTELKEYNITVPNTKTFIVRAKTKEQYYNMAETLFTKINVLDSVQSIIDKINFLGNSKMGKNRRNMQMGGVEAFDVKSIIPNSSREGTGQVEYDENSNQVIFLVNLSPTLEGNGIKFIKDVAMGDENMISKFVIASCEKLSRLHTIGIIHRDFKLDNIVFSPRQNDLVVQFGEDRFELTGFKYNVYIIDFEWSESFVEIRGYKIHTDVHWNGDDGNHDIRPYVPEIKEGLERTSISNGFDVMNINMPYSSDIRGYLNEVVPRVFGMDTYYILTDLIRIAPSNKLMRVLFRIFALYRSLSIADSEKRNRGKVDYEDVEAEGFARTFISYFT